MWYSKLITAMLLLITYSSSCVLLFFVKMSASKKKRKYISIQCKELAKELFCSSPLKYHGSIALKFYFRIHKGTKIFYEYFVIVIFHRNDNLKHILQSINTFVMNQKSHVTLTYLYNFNLLFNVLVSLSKSNSLVYGYTKEKYTCISMSIVYESRNSYLPFQILSILLNSVCY